MFSKPSKFSAAKMGCDSSSLWPNTSASATRSPTILKAPPANSRGITSQSCFTLIFFIKCLRLDELDEDSSSEDYVLEPEPQNTSEIIRKRGRPKGSKNKRKFGQHSESDRDDEFTE